MSGIPGRDGLQPERTALAWQRTALVSTFSAVAVMALGVRLADWTSAVVGGFATITGVVLTEVVRARVRSLRDDEAVAAAQGPPLLAVSLAVSLTAVAAVVTAARLVAS